MSHSTLAADASTLNAAMAALNMEARAPTLNPPIGLAATRPLFPRIPDDTQGTIYVVFNGSTVGLTQSLALYNSAMGGWPKNSGQACKSLVAAIMAWNDANPLPRDATASRATPRGPAARSTPATASSAPLAGVAPPLTTSGGGNYGRAGNWWVVTTGNHPGVYDDADTADDAAGDSRVRNVERVENEFRAFRLFVHLYMAGQIIQL